LGLKSTYFEVETVLPCEDYRGLWFSLSSQKETVSVVILTVVSFKRGTGFVSSAGYSVGSDAFQIVLGVLSSGGLGSPFAWHHDFTLVVIGMRCPE
jgi:hypothetical protein